MSIRTSPWPAGVPCWADLTTPDVAAARDFYANVLGWSFLDTGGEYGGYVLAQVRDQAVAGVGPLPSGAPTAWTLYLASDDADKTAQQVTEHGGRLLLEPGDVGPLGRMFVAADPTGAVFGVWQAKPMIRSSLVNEPGGITWEALRTTDPDAARAFYTGVFGYETAAIEGAPPDYTTFAAPGDQAPLGGMGGMMGADEDVPPHWLVYFGVADAAAAVQTAERLGGTTLSGVVESPYGTMAALIDPAGAVFWVVQTAGAELPDRSG